MKTNNAIKFFLISALLFFAGSAAYGVFKGDFEPDGDVDFDDYAVFANNWYFQSDESAPPPTPQPTSAWWKLDESSGTSAADSSVNNNTGTLHNMNDSDWVAGKIDNALDFDGSDDYVQVADHNSISFGTGSFSIAFWIKKDWFNSDGEVLINGSSGPPPAETGNRYEIANTNSYPDGDGTPPTGAIVFVIDNHAANNKKVLTSDTTFVTGDWVHCVCIRDASVPRLYIYRNAVLDDDKPGHALDIDSSDEPLYFGQNEDGGNRFEGQLDDIRFYNYVLSGDDINDLYNASPGVADSPANFNDDNIVDFKDLDILLEDWLEYEPIDRYSLVSRHNPAADSADSLSPLSVGNGGFTFTADITGLQSFPDFYSGGIPLCIQSDWGWHTFDNPNGYNLEDTLVEVNTYGRMVKYAAVSSEHAEACEWLRSNPHRLGLARVGLKLKKSGGSEAALGDCTNIDQELDLWRGVLTSRFKIEGQDVQVETCCHPTMDMIAVRIESGLISADRLSVTIEFPYGSSSWGREPGDWSNPLLHDTTIIDETATTVDLRRTLDDDVHYVTLDYSSAAEFNEVSAHHYELDPCDGNSFEFMVAFSEEAIVSALPGFSQSLSDVEAHWQDFWSTGGAIDLSASTNPQADELERRIVLSQYLTAIQCAGTMPPAETGLTCNSWYGTPHLEMHWWHGVHFTLWGRSSLFEQSLDWYETILPKAQATATLQGYTGARWPKMAGPEGEENPSSIATFVLWQQPHPIYYAELGYTEHPNQAWLEQYDTIVFETAEFIASFMYWKESEQRYILGPPIMPAQERYTATSTYNPTFELEYWLWGLQTAQLWRERLGLGRNTQWDHVIDNFSQLPVSGGLYLANESTPDTWTNDHWHDHPSMLMAYGFLNGGRVDVETMSRTLDEVMEKWDWPSTWGWDYPMIAMTAARVGKPETAIDALLMATGKNTYLPNGHNYQNGALPIYLPGNGGLLSAAAMMAAGWDGAPNRHAPGFPDDGTWKVRWEGLKPMP